MIILLKELLIDGFVRLAKDPLLLGKLKIVDMKDFTNEMMIRLKQLLID